MQWQSVFVQGTKIFPLFSTQISLKFPALEAREQSHRNPLGSFSNLPHWGMLLSNKAVCL